MHNTNESNTILLVDDEYNILKSLQRFLETEHFQVFIASNGQEGLEILETQKIDIIISDMCMPEMNGAAFLKITAERWPETKRLLLTGYADIDASISAINEGRIDFYLTKPWDNEHVLRIINQFLENKRLHEKNLEYQNLINEQNEELIILNEELEQRVEERTNVLTSTLKRLRSSYLTATQVLVSLVELYEGETKGHCRQVATNAKLLAQALDMPEKDVGNIYLSGMLYNIGKIGFPPSLTKKSVRQFKTDEYDEFKQYPILGAAVLKHFEPLKAISDIILYHRENYNGSGYPNQLSEKDIPLPARVLSLAVDYSELQEGLVIDERCLPQKALEYIELHSGNKYDPSLAQIFIQLMQGKSDEKGALNERVFNVSELSPGMVLSRDLTSRYGLTLMNKGTVLTQESINPIKNILGLKAYVEQG